MAKFLDSQSLEPINRALLIAGKGSERTELMDGTVEQTLDVGPFARRGGVLAGTEGIFRGLLRNVHLGAADIINSGFVLYGNNPSIVVSPTPGKIPPQYEWWLFSCCMTRFTGSINPESAMLQISNLLQCFGVDNSGAQVVANVPLILTNWDGLGVVGPNVFGITTAVNGSAGVYRNIGIRVPRGGAFGASPQLQFTSVADAAAGTLDCTILMGLFPITMGQDAQV